MPSSDRPRSSSPAAEPPVRAVDSDGDEEGDEEYEYEEVEVEEEIEVEEEVEVEEEEGEEPVEEEHRKEEQTKDELKEEHGEEEKSASEDQVDEEKEDASSSEDEEVEEEVEVEEEEAEEVVEGVEEDKMVEKRHQPIQEGEAIGAEDSPTAAINKDSCQDLLPRQHDECSRSNLSRSMNSEIRAPSDFGDTVGKGAEFKFPGSSEIPTKEAGLIRGDESGSGYDSLSDDHQNEMDAGCDKVVNVADTLKGYKDHDRPVDVGAQLDELIDVNDTQILPGKEEITSGPPFVGETGGEANPLPDHMETDEQLDVQQINEISKCASRSSTPLTRRRSLSPDTGLRNREKRPATVCEFFAKGWCIKGSTCRFLHRRDDTKLEGDAAPGSSDQQHDGGSGAAVNSYSSPYSSGFIPSGGDKIEGMPEQCNLSETPTVSGISSSVHHNFSEHKPGLGGYPFPYRSGPSSRLSRHTSLEEPSLKPVHFMPNDHSASDAGHSVITDRVADWVNHSSSYSSLREGYFGPQKPFGSDIQHRSSLVSNPFSSSIASMERSYHDRVSGVSRVSFGNMSNMIPYNWETSTPFRPSSSMPTLTTLSPGSQYDPIRDSIEQSDTKDMSVKPSSGGLLFQGTISSRKKQSYAHKKDIPMVEAESAANSATERHNRISMPKDESSSGQAGTDRGRKHRNDVLRRSTELKADKSWQNSEWDVDLAGDEDTPRESKAVKHFRAALVEFVKELMKPVWHEGHLTKDAYKIIVRKAEEKVVNSLQPNHVPSTAEQIKQYLSSSRTKISKLIEGYADKYGKSGSNQALV